MLSASGSCSTISGTGYSSLSWLKERTFTEIKVDRSFISGLPVDKGDLAIAWRGGSDGAGVCLAQTVEQLAAVQLLGRDRAQGFLFARPLLLGLPPLKPARSSFRHPCLGLGAAGPSGTRKRGASQDGAGQGAVAARWRRHCRPDVAAADEVVGERSDDLHIVPKPSFSVTLEPLVEKKRRRLLRGHHLETSRRAERLLLVAGAQQRRPLAAPPLCVREGATTLPSSDRHTTEHHTALRGPPPGRQVIAYTNLLDLRGQARRSGDGGHRGLSKRLEIAADA